MQNVAPCHSLATSLLLKFRVVLKTCLHSMYQNDLVLEATLVDQNQRQSACSDALAHSFLIITFYLVIFK